MSSAWRGDHPSLESVQFFYTGGEGSPLAGRADIVVGDDGRGTSASEVWILLGNGRGTFKAAAKTPVRAGPYRLFAADFNGDGKIDIATSNDNAMTVSVLFGKGDGTFQIPMALVGVQYPGSPVAANFYGTGRADIAVMDIVANTCWFFRRSRMAHSRRRRVFQPEVNLDI